MYMPIMIMSILYDDAPNYIYTCVYVMPSIMPILHIKILMFL